MLHFLRYTEWPAGSPYVFSSLLYNINCPICQGPCSIRLSQTPPGAPPLLQSPEVRVHKASRRVSVGEVSLEKRTEISKLPSTLTAPLKGLSFHYYPPKTEHQELSAPKQSDFIKNRECWHDIRKTQRRCFSHQADITLLSTHALQSTVHRGWDNAVCAIFLAGTSLSHAHPGEQLSPTATSLSSLLHFLFLPDIAPPLSLASDRL